MTKKQTKPRFKKGDSVISQMFDGIAIIDEEPQWNGLTWMYSFKDKEVRLGEMI